ncbi:MAG: hypothetical protein LBQ76_00780 [Candidatus Fibromonas sp.]|jgi:hypothetical protein|nr:hypothetical protein [Candidatus Fibromonas sp.]
MKTFGKSLVFVFLLIIFISNANAEDSKEQNHQKISIYLHPHSFILTWMLHQITIFGTDPIPFYRIYLTFEIPLNLSNSLIIQPSLWYSESPGSTHIEYNGKLIDKMFRLGPGIGFRHFVSGNGKGLYFQAMSDIHYYSIKELDEISYKKGFYADLLGYLGYSWKFSRLSIFSDIGVGIIYPVNNSSREVIIGLYKKPLTFDINFGIGLSL